MSVAPESGRNRIMIYGPKNDGTYIVEFTTAAGEARAISIPRTETAVIRHFQERMPCGLFVPEPRVETWRAREFARRSSVCLLVFVNDAIPRPRLTRLGRGPDPLKLQMVRSTIFFCAQQ